MNKEDYSKFTEAYQAIYGFYGKEITTMMLSIAFAALMEYELVDIGKALQAHIKNPEAGKWPAKPADIIKYIDGGPGDRAEIALTSAYRSAQRCGSYESVCFGDPIIHNVIRDMGGWVAWCAIEEKERPFKHNEFRMRYAGAVSSGRKDHPKYLPGLNEIGNSRKGFDEFVKPPYMIGDEEKAKKVYLTGVISSSGFKRLNHLTVNSVKKLDFKG
jgi:hypothetical protein